MNCPKKYDNLFCEILKYIYFVINDQDFKT